MTAPTSAPCPKCQSPLIPGVNFCGNCGALISGVWGSRTEMFGSTVAVQVTESTDTLAELLTKATLGEYDVYGELGRGGMAAVYLALDLALNRKVAIKTMLPDLVVKTDMVERFKREAQTAAGLSHPHIIQIFAVKQTRELVYFVMKFIEGRSLEAIAAESGPMNVGLSQMILGQVASALAYAHRKGVVHRDVKPANVMIDEDGWSIVTDFGIAKVQVAQNLTATGTAIGTPTYMSPEQFHNKSISGASDQYSLGVVAYEILTGRKPFDGATYAEIITQHLFEPVPDIRQHRPDLPDNLVQAINRMLAKSPGDRFPDLDAAAIAIGQPDRADADRLRGEMISMAKAGPRRTVRMSVPVSPIPMTKGPTGASQAPPAPAAATVVAKGGAAPAAAAAASAPTRAARPRPAPRTESGRPRIPMWAIAACAVLVVGGGFGIYKAVSGPDAPSAPPPVATQPQEPPTAAPTTPPPTQRADSQPAAAVAAKTSTKTEAPAPTESKTAPSREPATITVLDVPANAVIMLDGRRQSSRQFTASPGTHQLRVQVSGFETMNRPITVRAGQDFSIPFTGRELAAVPSPTTQPVQPVTKQAPAVQQGSGLARLRVTIQPPATLFIDGDSKGEKSRTEEELVPGTHTVRAEKAGFITKDTVVTILAGSTATLRLQLTPRQ